MNLIQLRLALFLIKAHHNVIIDTEISVGSNIYDVMSHHLIATSYNIPVLAAVTGELIVNHNRRYTNMRSHARRMRPNVHNTERTLGAFNRSCSLVL